jgi:uncharacterized membrane protein YgcG
MKKAWFLFIMMTCFILPGYTPVIVHADISPAIDCDALVVDDAGVMGAKSADVAKEAQTLEAQGIDVRVRTIAHSTNLDLTEKQFEQSCASWQSADGKRKNTLLALLVAPKDRQMGIYYGGMWHPALDAYWNHIKTYFMAPKFRDGDFAGGFILTMQEIQKRVIAAQDEKMHPTVAQSTTVVQPTDYSGFWHFLMWLLVLTALGAGVTGLYMYSTRKKETEDTTSGAQQAAQLSKARVADRLRRLASTISLQKATDNVAATQWEKHLGIIQENFADLAGQEKTDPNQPGLTQEGYVTLRDLYDGVGEKLDELEAEMAGPKPTEHSFESTVTGKYIGKADHHKHAEVKAKAAAVGEDSHSHYVERDTTVVPMVIPFPVEEREPYIEPVESHTSHHSSDDDEDSGSGGGSSSFGGSDDSGGGSSSWGGDSGGGGGSDFGGGDGGSGFGGGGGSSGF